MTYTVDEMLAFCKSLKPAMKYMFPDEFECIMLLIDSDMTRPMIAEESGVVEFKKGRINMK